MARDFRTPRELDRRGGLIAAASGCSEGGAKCDFGAPIAGTARIVSIEPAPSNWGQCPAPDPVVVRFDFTPSDPAQSTWAATGWALTVGGGRLQPPRDRVDGSCGIVVIRLDDVDYFVGGDEACYPR